MTYERWSFDLERIEDFNEVGYKRFYRVLTRLERLE